MTWIGGGMAQTHPLVDTRVVQTGVERLAERPRVVQVASTAVGILPRSCPARAAPRAQPHQGGALTQVLLHRHVEPQSQPAQLGVPLVQSHEITIAGDKPPRFDPLPPSQAVGKQRLTFRRSRAAPEVVRGHVEEDEAVRLQARVGGHQQCVSTLQLQRAQLGEAVSRRPGGVLALDRPTLGLVRAQALSERQLDLDCPRLGMPVQRAWAAAGRLAVGRVSKTADEHCHEEERYALHGCVNSALIRHTRRSNGFEPSTSLDLQSNALPSELDYL